MTYRKWSVPDDLADKIDEACAATGHEKRGERWDLIDMAMEYVLAHVALFRKR